MPAEGTRMARLWEREVGHLPPRRFTNAVRASEEFVHSLGLQKRLRKHTIWVHTLGFNSSGSLLMSASRDNTVALWNLEEAEPRLTFQPGHDVSDAKFMPLSDDRSIVMSGGDGEVRHTRIGEGGHVFTDKLAGLRYPVTKLAVEPGIPHTFFSCVDDGSVFLFDLRRKYPQKLFKCGANRRFGFLSGRTVKLRAVAVDPRNPSCFAVCGSDEYVRLYDARKISLEVSKFGVPVEQFCPQHLVSNDDKTDGISGLAFSHTGELLASYRYENIYLFSREHGLYFNDFDENYTEKLHVPHTFKGHQNMQPIKGVSFFGPNCDYVTSGSDCGHVFIWRKKDGQLVRAMQADIDGVESVEQHPTEIIVASSGLETDVKIWAPGDSENPSTYIYDPDTRGGDSDSDGSSYMDDVDMFSSGDENIEDDEEDEDEEDGEEEVGGDEDQKDGEGDIEYMNDDW